MDVLTKYELAKIIGIRTLQLSQNVKPFVDTKPSDTYLQIVVKELQEDKLDFLIVRTYPGNRCIEVSIKDLQLPPDLDALASSLN